MNYKILFVIFFILISSCTNQNLNKKISEPIIFQKYSNTGFALVFNEDLFNEKIVNKKLNDRDLFVFQKNLKKDTSEIGRAHV